MEKKLTLYPRHTGQLLIGIKVNHIQMERKELFGFG